MKTEILGAYVVFPEAGKFIPRRQDIYIKDGIVSYTPDSVKADKTIFARDKVILPGLVNAHHHIYSTLSKGIPCETPFRNFSGNLRQLWWPLDHSLNKEDMTLSAVLACEESLKNGVTTIFDHHISGYTLNSLSDLADVFTAYGMSGTLAFEISDRNGSEFFQDSLQENIRFAEKQQKQSVKGMIGLHASFTLSDASLAEISRKTGDTPIHVHVAEGKIDGDLCLEKYGKSLIERFNSFNLLRPGSMLIHCSNLTAKDLEILRDKDVFIVQAIDSNLNNALHVGNISSFISASIKTTVGTDGMTSSILKALKNSVLFTRYQNKSSDIGFEEMNALLSDNYALKERWGFPVGVIENDPADLVIFDYRPSSTFDSDSFLGHFIYGITEHRAEYVIKGDRILLDNYCLTAELYEKLKLRRQEITARLFDRFRENRKLYKN